MTHYIPRLLFCLVASGCLLVVATAWSQQTPIEGDDIIGVWLTADGKAHVAVRRASEQYSGEIVWLKEPEKNGKPAVDDQNPDEL